MKKRLRQSKYWKRRYAQWSECLSDGSTLFDLCYNKHLEIGYFIENDYIFRHILNSKFFNVFCENPNVTWDFLKPHVTNNCNISLNKRIITLVNPNARLDNTMQTIHI